MSWAVGKMEKGSRISNGKLGFGMEHGQGFEDMMGMAVGWIMGG